MTIDDKNVLWLDLFESLAYNKKLKLLELNGKGRDIRQNFLSNSYFKEVLSNDEFNKMALCLHESYLEKALLEYQNKNVQTVTFYDEKYPYILKEISSPPLCLYLKGNIQLLNTFCLAVVGTRRPSEYGIVVTKQFVKTLAKAGVTIVSGLASGIDTIAHKTTIENNGSTIAVLAGGFDYIYPASNYALAKQITENNLLITEYPPKVKPLSYHFPIRNRIIAGLSKGVFIPEAGEKSGSLHTVNYAIEYNRDLFVVPGRINSEMSKGSNEIIKQYNNAIVLTPEDILENFNLSIKDDKHDVIQIDLEVQNILNFIQTDKKTFQQILDYTKMNVQDLNSILLELEMSGLILKLANNSYIMS